MSDEPSREAPRDNGKACLAVGLFSLAWAVAILLPHNDLPAWPAASAGILAIAVSRMPGGAMLRGLGAFLGLVGLLVGAAKILALWGLLRALD